MFSLSPARKAAAFANKKAAAGFPAAAGCYFLLNFAKFELTALPYWSITMQMTCLPAVAVVRVKEYVLPVTEDLASVVLPGLR